MTWENFCFVLLLIGLSRILFAFVVEFANKPGNETAQRRIVNIWLGAIAIILLAVGFALVKGVL